MRTLTLVVLCLASVANAAMVPELEKASSALADGKPGAALAQLDAAAKSGRLDRDNLVQLYLLRGMAYAVERKGEAKAKAAFQAVLWLQPDAGLPPSADGKAFKVFRAAKDWARKEGPMEFRAEPAATDDKGKVMQIAAYLKSDPLKLVRKVRFHVRTNGGAWTEALESVQSSYAATATEAEGVEWWAELLTDRDSVLATIGSEDAPVLEGKAKAAKKPPPAKPVAKAEPKKEPAAEKKPEVEEKKPEDAPVTARSEGEDRPKEQEVERVQTAPARPFVVTPMRGLGFGLAGAGVVAALIGVFAGVGSAGDRAKLNALPSDGSLVTTMTQKEAFATEQSANGAATAANILMITGGVLAAGGIVMIIAGGPGDDAKVTLAPAGSGVLLSGTIP